MTKKKKKVCFSLVRLYPLLMPFFSSTLLHNNLAIYQSLLKTIVIGTCTLVKIMGFGHRIYGFEFEHRHLLCMRSRASTSSFSKWQ